MQKRMVSGRVRICAQLMAPNANVGGWRLRERNSAQSPELQVDTNTRRQREREGEGERESERAREENKHKTAEAQMTCNIKRTFHLSPDVKHHHSTGSMGIPACASRAILQVYQDEDSPQFSLLRFLHCSELLYYYHAILGHLDALSGPKRPAKLPGPNNKEKVHEFNFLYPIHINPITYMVRCRRT